VVNLTRSEAEPEASHRLQDPVDVGELIVNLRAEGDPIRLRGVLESAIVSVANRMGVAAETTRAEAFRPGRPVPTHRDLQGGAR
jgi:hypothetical protein